MIFIREIFHEGKIYKYTGIRFYYISEFGEILSDFNNKRKIMRPFVTSDGYLRIELKYKPGKAKKYSIHRLVYQTFVGELKEGFVIDHIDANRTNNHYTNLRLCTQKENIQNAIRHKNFGNNNAKKITIRDKRTNDILNFNRIKDLIDFVGLPISNGSSTKLLNHSKFKKNYEVLYID